MRKSMRPWTTAGAALFLALAAALALPNLTACQAETSPPKEEQPTTAETDNLSAEAAMALAEHYRELMAELEETVLSLREERYIENLAYEARIAELEAALAALKKQPNSGTQNGTPTESTSAVETESTPPPSNSGEVMAFRYGMEDGHAVIYEYLGDEADVVIPGAIDGYPVTHIAADAFNGKTIETLVIPYGVREIGWFAFAGCTQLRSVHLPPSLETVGYGAFDGVGDAVFRVQSGSYAEAYARSFGFYVEIE